MGHWETIVPAGTHLGDSRDGDGKKASLLFEDGTNRLLGPARVIWVDDDDVHSSMSDWPEEMGSPHPQGDAAAESPMAGLVLLVAILLAPKILDGARGFWCSVKLRKFLQRWGWNRWRSTAPAEPADLVRPLLASPAAFESEITNIYNGSHNIDERVMRAYLIGMAVQENLRTAGTADSILAALPESTRREWERAVSHLSDKQFLALVDDAHMRYGDLPLESIAEHAFALMPPEQVSAAGSSQEKGGVDV